MNAAEVVKAIKIEPGTLGHDQWLALRVSGGTVVGSYTVGEIIAALGGTEGSP